MEGLTRSDVEWIIHSFPKVNEKEFPASWIRRRNEITEKLNATIKPEKGQAMRQDTFESTDLMNDAYQNEHLRTTIPMSKWKDISSELYREYRFPCGNLVRIDHPRFLLVSKSGGHRVFDGEYSHYLPAGWIHLHWKAKNDHPHFDF